MQTETQCPWWDAKLVARGADQGDTTSGQRIVPKLPFDTVGGSSQIQLRSRLVSRQRGVAINELCDR